VDRGQPVMHHQSWLINQETCASKMAVKATGVEYVQCPMQQQVHFSDKQTDQAGCPEVATCLLSLQKPTRCCSYASTQHNHVCFHQPTWAITSRAASRADDSSEACTGCMQDGATRSSA
jgi:hypothetical protein